MWVVRTVGGMPLDIPISRHQGCCSLTIPQCIGQLSTVSSSLPNINSVKFERPKARWFNQFLYKAKYENITVLKIDIYVFLGREN